MLGEDEGGHGLEHQDLAPRPLAPVVGEADGLRGGDADDVVGHHHWHEAWGPVRTLEGRSDAGHALDTES